MAALTKKGLDLRVSKHGDLLVGEGALHAIGIVAKVVLLFISQYIVMGRSIYGVRRKLQKGSCEVVGRCCAEVGVMKGEQVVLMSG